MVGTTWVYHQCSSRPGNESSIFPKRRFVAGFFRRLLAYIISCISISIIPHILFQYASLQYVSFQYVSIQYASSSRVSIQYISIQYVCISRNGNECECKTYPCIVCISWNGIVLPFAPPRQSIFSPGIFQCHFYYFPRSEAF